MEIETINNIKDFIIFLLSFGILAFFFESFLEYFFKKGQKWNKKRKKIKKESIINKEK